MSNNINRIGFRDANIHIFENPTLKVEYIYDSSGGVYALPAPVPVPTFQKTSFSPVFAPFVPIRDVPLGNITTYSAKPNSKGKQKWGRKGGLSEQEVKRRRHYNKGKKVSLKRKIGGKVDRVDWCGTRCCNKHENPENVNAVEGSTGHIFYWGMMRCGSVWFCPDCSYKLMKVRAAEIYKQLKCNRDAGKTVLFTTFTLQHHKGQRLGYLHNHLLRAFNFANSHSAYIEAKEGIPVEYLRCLEILLGDNGWHPHLHCVFVGDDDVFYAVEIFVELYKKYLTRHGFLVNEHTVYSEEWNGDIDKLKDYVFKGEIENELIGGNFNKNGKGKTFFQFFNTDEAAADEYIAVMKGKRQYHHSKGFFKDVRVKSDAQILKDDSTVKILFSIPYKVFRDMVAKGISDHLLNEYEYGGMERAKRFLKRNNVDVAWINTS